jgi:myo-inositol-1(or 4)-monophosphatase
MTANEASATPAALLDLARDIAERAAGAALEARRKGIEVAATKSSPVDVVTAVDVDTEALIRELILDARPDDGILGEEGATRSGTSGIDWVVDPIDGTVNLLYGVPAWSVSVAVVQGPPDPAHWRALAGVVVNPVSGEVYEASAGGGARRNGKPIGVNQDVALARALVGTGFGYDSDQRRRQAQALVRILPDVRDIRRVGSAALDLCWVASGRLDAFFEEGLNPWDHAAGAIIAREAGAIVGGSDGGPESSELLVAAAPSLYEEFAALVAEARAGG